MAASVSNTPHSHAHHHCASEKAEEAGRICLTKEHALLKWDKGHSLHRSCP